MREKTNTLNSEEKFDVAKSFVSDGFSRIFVYLFCLTFVVLKQLGLFCFFVRVWVFFCLRVPCFSVAFSGFQGTPKGKPTPYLGNRIRISFWPGRDLQERLQAALDEENPGRRRSRDRQPVGGSSLFASLPEFMDIFFV